MPGWGNVIPMSNNHGKIITTNKKRRTKEKLILNFPSWGVCVCAGVFFKKKNFIMGFGTQQLMGLKN